MILLFHMSLLIGLAEAFQTAPPFQPTTWTTSPNLSVSTKQRLAPFSISISTPRQSTPQQTTTSSLHGKLWKRLEIEEDTPEMGTSWYLINCVAGVEFDLLTQAREVTKHFPKTDVEKIVVPTERRLRSHGDKKKVVDVKVRYPGYVFCKIRLTEDVYETLQELELARSWMGTVNRKGHKKLPPAPLPLNEEEVKKFKGLEEEQELFDDMFGGDYSGRNDSGEDLLAQYAGYEVGQMVKILRGNFEGEDGTVRRLKDGQICVRMFTYGQTFDNWFDPDAIRPLSDLEVMRGFTGPSSPINQDQFDVSIGKKDPSILENTSEGKSGLLQSAGMGAGRNRRQDRIARGETGRDLFGRTPEEIKREEENWLAYREEKRASQRGGVASFNSDAAATKKKVQDGPKKGHDTWGIVERSSWDGGEYGFEANSEAEEIARMSRTEELYKDRGDFRAYDRSQRSGRGRNFREDSRGPRSARDFREDSKGPRPFDDKQSSSRDFSERKRGDNAMLEQRRPVREFRGGRDGPQSDKFGRSRRVKEEDWASASEAVNTDSDDFFSNLMKELKDENDSSSSRARGTRHHDNAGPNIRTEKNRDSEDSFFENLMSELGTALDAETSADTDPKPKPSDNDFFANLESELSSSLSSESGLTSVRDDTTDNDDDAFFASLEYELTSSLNGDNQKGKHKKESTRPQKVADDDFFASLQQEMNDALNQPSRKHDTSLEDDFFSGLMDDVADELEIMERKEKTVQQSTVKVQNSPKDVIGDLNSLSVPQLKEILRSKGLKVGGRKSELIQRLQSN
ncbi:hypothetical protein HJC23_002337 [Cyclotella cryptica]|uniref:SAP domain-containing protein n=1 Tax=Cyclotella cryptica TaxID=29204 RepID=A0ABD3QLZ1_9STRA|eukprot:CCRYP_004427-RA/>CCRYP_004427-RA protein AED:0.12 eAED:0.12 QI:0/-1/0/1/-1/1/1/0/795